MPRSPNPKYDKAEVLYHNGMKMVDIAKKLGIAEGTIRRWKHEKDWDGSSKKKQIERSEPKEPVKANVRKRGAPAGNKNAKGGKGNPHPVKPLKHGGYSKIYWDTLDDEELEILADMQTDTEFLLIQQIQLFTIRERRLMKAIAKYREAGPLYVSMSSTEKNVRKFKTKDEEERYNRIVEEKISSGERMPGENNKVYSQTQATEDLINRLRRELTSVQSQKTKAITALQQYRAHVEEMQSAQAGNDAVDDWISAVMGGKDE